MDLKKYSETCEKLEQHKRRIKESTSMLTIHRHAQKIRECNRQIEKMEREMSAGVKK
jgi:hypothetical protein